MKNKKNKKEESLARNLWLFGLGTVAAIEEETEKLASQVKTKSDEITSKAQEVTQNRIDELSKKAADIQDQMSSQIDNSIKEVVNNFGIPSQSQIRDLSIRVENLTKKVEAYRKRVQED